MPPEELKAIEDIFSLLDLESLIRTSFKDKINLRDYHLPKFQLDGNYSSLAFEIRREEDTLDYHNKIVEICKEGKHTGKHEKFHTAIIEAFRNAYQHGNQKDPHKKITLAYKSTEDSFEVVISDEGGKIDANFAPFVLLHRQGLEQPYSFYRFAPQIKQKPENSGIGTYVIHMNSDEVKYFTNESGGLSIQMIIKKEG